MCGSVPEIFAIKVESCQKSRRILDVFSPSKILGGRPSKSYIHFITPTLRHVEWKRFYEDTPISPEVLVCCYTTLLNVSVIKATIENKMTSASPATAHFKKLTTRNNVFIVSVIVYHRLNGSKPCVNGDMSFLWESL